MQLSTRKENLLLPWLRVRNRGFTLVDSIAALALLGALVVFSAVVLGQLRRYQRDTQWHRHGLRLAANSLESAMANPVRSAGEPSRTIVPARGELPKYVITIDAADDPQRDATKIVVRTMWQDSSGLPRDVTLVAWSTKVPGDAEVPE